MKKLGENITEKFKSESLKFYFIDPIKKKDSPRNKSEPSRGKLPIKWRNLMTASKVPTPNENENSIEGKN